MISDQLKEEWVQAACIIDVAPAGARPVPIRDHMELLQINKLFQQKSLISEPITDDRFWYDQSLKIAILRAINTRKSEIGNLTPAIQALTAMYESYDSAFSHKAFGYCS